MLEAVKECHVLLKGPTMTPGKGDNMPNLESANVKLRKELDLFANVRPVSIPEKNINWTFFRENTEGEYALGSQGVDINDDISMDFKVTTTIGTTRLARAAFEFAKANGNQRVTIVTKANIMKKTDGKFLSLCSVSYTHLSRGNLVYKDGEFLGKKGDGKFVKCNKIKHKTPVL